MKIVLAVAALMTTTLAVAAGPEAPVAHVGHDKVAEAFAKGGSIAEIPGVVVQVTDRHAAENGPLIHLKMTHVYYIVEGEAMFMTGGTLVNPQAEGPLVTRGTTIQGGEIRHLVKGDIIVVPAGTPHGWKKLPTKFVRYYAVDISK